jgi:hypothetical protein
MVRALLDGRKTQTRRTLKFQPGELDKPFMMADGSWHVADSQGGHMSPLPIRIKVGDRLWCKETWKPHSIYADRKPSEIPESKIFYRADDAYAPSNTKWWPSLFMLRWASRLTLFVTDVRIERLQDISEADAIAEGCKQYSSATKLSRPFHAEWKGIYREGYAELWNEINGAGAWESNPWVVAYTFTVHHGNIDAMSKEEA